MAERKHHSGGPRQPQPNPDKPASCIPPICLLTDFGLADPYVAQMKGGILRHLPKAAIVDLSHDVPPYALPTAALFLAASRAYFPAGAVFVCVVDPGVGTARRIVAVEKDDQTILAPDNGLLGPILAASGPVSAYDLTAHADAPGVSATFHGRDVFAPLAARIAAGEPPATLGSEFEPTALKRLPWAAPDWNRDVRSVHAAVLHVDRFGNAVTNIPGEAAAELRTWGDLTFSAAPNSCDTIGHATHESGTDAMPATLPADADGFRVEHSQDESVQFAHSYGSLPSGSLGLIAGSQGYLEFAMNQTSAADAAGLAPGTTFTLSARAATPANTKRP